MKPIVSVCVAAYNHANYIRECIDGILMQQCDFPYEVIIGEDESSDQTREICLEYAEAHPERIRLFLRNRRDVIYVNGHATGRYNSIENLRAARGEFIALCEGDDYWTHPEKLQRQVDLLRSNQEYAICFHDAVVVGDQKPENVRLYSDFEWCKMVTDRKEYGVEDLLAGPLMPTASIVLRNDFTKQFPRWFTKIMSADMALCILALRDRKIRLLDETMCVYRKHSGGITVHHRNDQIHLNRIYMYRQLNLAQARRHNDLIQAKIKEHMHLIHNPLNKIRALFL